MAPNSLCTALLTRRAVPLQLPLFLVPSFASVSAPPPKRTERRSYANHAALPERGPDPSASRKHLKPDFPMNTRMHNRDKNKKRGVSAIRSTGPRHKGSLWKHDLPVPVIDPERRKQFPTNPNHGLWAFFYEGRKAMISPEEMAGHGRAWTYAELSLKSFEDLHALYWVGHREMNRILTNTFERKRVHAGYGDFEDEEKEKIIKQTNKRIMGVLRDRYDSIQEANLILEGKKPLSELNLDDIEEEYVDVDESAEIDGPEDIAEIVQASRTAQVPQWSQLNQGSHVHIVLKKDQPTGKLTTGTIADFLSSGDHPKGIKVRLTDGQVGRVQAVAE